MFEAIYQALLDSNSYKLLRKENKVSLFGIQLCVNTIPLQEQDKVVAACATSALWVSLNASNNLVDNCLPSPSTITKAATNQNSNGLRVFPNKGLQPNQIAQCLKAYDLEPTIETYNFRDYPVDKSDLKISEIKQQVFAYLNNDIPLLLGGVVYRRNIDGLAEKIGRHIVCVLGYKLNKDYKFDDNVGLMLQSDSIDRLYAHDDRYGPYAKFDLDMKEWSVGSKGEMIKGSLIKHSSGGEDLFIPDLIIFGHYHKIRIKYDEIYRSCLVIHKIFSVMYVENLFDDKSEGVVTLKKSINSMLRGVWGIALTTANQLKNDILKVGKEEWGAANGIEQKSVFLTRNLPRYIWRCKVYSNDMLFAELLFDATEVPQGNTLLGYVSYSNVADIFWQYARSEARAEQFDRFKVLFSADIEQDAFNAFIRFFKETKTDIGLNTIYGPASLPFRKMKNGEINDLGNVSIRDDLITIRSNGVKQNILLGLKKDQEYIWVVNVEGDLIIGKDIAGGDSDQGHISLVDGAPARVGGDLIYSEIDEQWEVSTKSGAYSKYLEDDPDTAKIYLANVVRDKFAGEGVVMW